MFKFKIALLTFFLSLIFNLPLNAVNREYSWGSLKYNKTYLRTGPSKDNKVMWVYKRKGLPIKVLREKEDWKQILLPENQKGWISSSQFSKKRTVLVIDTNSETEKVIKNIDPLAIKDLNNNPIAYVHKGVILKLMKCSNEMCEIELDIKKEKYFFKNSFQINGLIEKKNLWGIN